MVQGQQPRPPELPPLSVSISLSEIYNVLCPNCRDALLDAIISKAGAGQLREGLRKQLEHPIVDARCKEARDVPL